VKVTIALAIVLVVSQIASLADGVDGENKILAPPIYAVTYDVSDLPVWSGTGKDAKFSPDVLVSFLRLSVDPNSWALGAEIRAANLNGRPVFVVAQTEANHEKIADAFDSYREDVKKRIWSALELSRLI
jgi:hypothetical protein